MKLNKKTTLISAGIIIVAIAAAAIFWFNQANSEQQQNRVPSFKLADVEGGEFTIEGRSPKPVILHFMAVACGGDFNSINDERLRSFIEIKERMGDDVEIVTVLVTTCTTTDLVLLKNWYNVTWTFGNDYDDYKLDILESFKEYELTDGSMIICNSRNQFVELIRDEISVESLIGKLEALLA